MWQTQGDQVAALVPAVSKGRLANGYLGVSSPLTKQRRNLTGEEWMGVRAVILPNGLSPSPKSPVTALLIFQQFEQETSLFTYSQTSEFLNLHQSQYCPNNL